MPKICLSLPLLFASAAALAASEPSTPGILPSAIARAHQHAPCAAAPHRQFDFWVGDFAVGNPAGAFVATNRITTDLDGCAVEEHWAPIGGTRGRSLNSYDPADGQWHQTWVTAGGRPIRMHGGLRPDGVMAMSGVRVRPPPRFPWVDAYTWTPVTPDQVVQAFTFDIFEVGFHLQGSLTYDRVADLPSVESAPTELCEAGQESGETRLLDFTLGEYAIHTEKGAVLGHAAIALDPTLSRCLIEESIAGPAGYRATGWLYYDSIEDRFYRTVVDNQGRRIELRGGVSAGGFAMEGADPFDPGSALRLTWTPLAGGDLRQVWERSADGGATWSPALTLTYARR